MTTGLLIEEANSQADALIAKYPWMQLHVIGEAVSGAPTYAGNNTRRDISLSFAAAVDGTATTDITIAWTDIEIDTTEKYAYASFWDAENGGTCGHTATLTATAVNATGDTFSIPAGSLTVSPTNNGLTSAQFDVFARAHSLITANGGDPYDTLGRTVVEKGSTEGGQAVVPFLKGGLAAACISASVATTRPFIITPSRDTPTSDVLDIRLLFYSDDYTNGVQVIKSKWNTSANQRVWRAYVDAAGALTVEWSSDGTITASETFAALTLVDSTPYAVRALLDVAGGTLDWSQHAAADARADDWSQTPILTETDTHALLTLNVDATVPIAIGADFAADPEVAGVNEFSGLIAYAQVRDGDGGTVMATWDPTTDAAIGDTSFVDSTTTDGWALASAVAVQTDWPTYAAPALRFDGGDWLQTTYTPPITDPTDANNAFTIVVVFTPAAGNNNFDRVLSSESAASNGINLSRWSSDAEYRFLIGGATTLATRAITDAANGTKMLLAGIIDGTNAFIYSSNGSGLSTAGSISGVGTITHTSLMIGNRPYDKNTPIAGDYEVVITYEAVLTEAQLDALSARYGL